MRRSETERAVFVRLTITEARALAYASSFGLNRTDLWGGGLVPGYCDQATAARNRLIEATAFAESQERRLQMPNEYMPAAPRGAGETNE